MKWVKVKIRSTDYGNTLTVLNVNINQNEQTQKKIIAIKAEINVTQAVNHISNSCPENSNKIRQTASFV